MDENHDKNSNLSRRDFFVKVAAGVLGAVVIAPAVAALTKMQDSDFDLDVRVDGSNPKSGKFADQQYETGSCVTCNYSCLGTCLGTCNSTCNSTCYYTCNNTCLASCPGTCGSTCYATCNCPPPSP
jgi:hypothetical protein